MRVPPAALGLLRVAAIVLFAAALIAGGFILFGVGPDPRLDLEGARAALQATGGWAWAAGIGLLVADLLIPVPSVAVMSALGVIYGPVLGGALAALGSLLAGLFGYGLARLAGRRVAEVLAGRRGLRAARRLFRHWGGVLVALSRWLPVLPEAVAIMAGLTRMPSGRYALALACGSASVGFAFAGLGHFGADRPFLTLGLVALLPLGVWAMVAPRLFAPLEDPPEEG